MSTEPNAVDHQKGFQRINFFRGFLTTEHDWNDAERYHIEKRMLHNRLCHAPGVLLGYGGDLKVVARARGDLSFEVLPGYAIDGEGRDLLLWNTEIKALHPEEYKLPSLLYVVLRFNEELTDFIAYKENLEYKGHRRVAESARVEISQTPPDLRREVELARILLEKSATRLRDARDPNDPRPNEIDLRFVPHAGVAGSRLDPTMRQRLAVTLATLRRSFLQIGREGRVLAAQGGLAAALDASALHAVELLDLRNVFDSFALLVEMQHECLVEIEATHPGLAQRKELIDYRKHTEIVKGLLGERRGTAEALDNVLAYERKAAELAMALFAAPRPNADATSPQAPKIEGLPQFKDWEQIKDLALENLPSEMAVGGQVWTMVDMINVMEKESEEAHRLQVVDAKDSYRSRQKLKYPGGTVLEDVGRAHVGGCCQYAVHNLTPGKELVVVRRIDYVYGDYELEYVVDGKPAGISDNKGTDRVHRWRNWPYRIPGELVAKPSVMVQQIAITAGRDINMFRYWFYQPK